MVRTGGDAWTGERNIKPIKIALLKEYGSRDQGAVGKGPPFLTRVKPSPNLTLRIHFPVEGDFPLISCNFSSWQHIPIEVVVLLQLVIYCSGTGAVPPQTLRVGISPHLFLKSNKHTNKLL